MVEINNQRRTSSICWRGCRADNGRQKPEIMVMTIVAESYLLITPITLTNLSR